MVIIVKYKIFHVAKRFSDVDQPFLERFDFLDRSAMQNSDLSINQYTNARKFLQHNFIF